MLKNSKLYLVLDREVAGYERLFEIAKKSVLSGVDIVQIRDKHGCTKDILAFAGKLLSFLKRKVPVIINDRIDLAIASGVDGVHLGQDDLPLSVARRLMGPNAIIGVSCQDLKHALVAQKEGADYIGFGSIFKTLTKPDRNPMDLGLLKKVLKQIKVPVFVIGGISQSNIAQLRILGANHFAVTRSICLARDVRQATLAIKKAIEI